MRPFLYLFPWRRAGEGKGNRPFWPLLLLFPLLAGGCWDRRELDNLALVASAALDWEKGDCLVTTEFFRPQMGMGEGGGMALTTGAQPRQAIFATGRGKTVFDAIRDLTLKTPRHAFWAHDVAVIVGEELAREGIAEVLDFWDRARETRRSTLILLTRGPARAILTTSQGGLERTLGKAILQMVETMRRSGYAFIPSIHEVFIDLVGDAATTVLPLVCLSPQTQPRPLTSFRPVPEEERDWREPTLAPALRVDGAGIFKRDRLAGWLTRRQVRGWLWVKNRVGAANLTVPYAGGRVSLEVKKVKVQVQSRVVKGKPRIHLTLQADVNLAEQDCPQNLTTQAALARLGRKGATVIREEIEAALAVAQGKQADIFGFANVVHRQHPRWWPRLKPHWPELFARLPVEIDTRVRVVRTGLTNKPLQFSQ